MKRLIIPAFLALLLPFLSCDRENQCHISIGITNFNIEPDAAYYQGLNNVGGYMYFVGGNRGVVIIRTSYTDFVAYERTCPHDNNSAVEVSEEYGSAILECPVCHSCFVVESDGIPIDGSATTCQLYQYSTTYSGGKLYVY